MEPTTAEQRAGLAISGNYTERCLVADIKRLEKDARQNAKLCKADNAWAMESYDTLKGELEKAREKVGELQFTAIMGRELNEADRHLRRIEELATTFLEGSK